MLGVLSPGAGGFLFSNLRRLCRLRYLPADLVARLVWSAARGCRLPDRRIRRARHPVSASRGWLSDRIGGSRVLSWILPVVAAFGLLLGIESMLPFTVGALGCAALLGIGNGAVFQLVPRYFPVERATVTGLVGAMGGMGGFFPPLLLGMFRERFGVVWPGFLLLSVVACLLWWMNARVFLPQEESLAEKLPADLTRTADRIRAGAWATLWTAILIAAIVLGSRNLQNFDPALVIYTFAIIFAT
jgi:MFS transporter, NNP family, nitrate/nitrite transporter